MKNFILHWGEMGTRWGVNRTVAQMHALLYLSPEPLNAEEISETLEVARSTVSTGLRELQSWGIVRIVHVLGDRRDHFEALSDVWEMSRVLADARKRREIDPIAVVLRESVAEQLGDGSEDTYAAKKLKEMLEFIETMMRFYEQVQKMPMDVIVRAVKLGDNLGKLVELFPAE